MDRRAVLTGAAAGIGALAGCSALPIWEDDDIDVEGGGAPEADPGGEPGEGPNVEYPAGYGPDGIEDAAEAIESHMDALVSHDNYIFTYEAVVTDDEGEAVFTFNQIADHENAVYYEVQDSADGALVRFFEDDRVYVQDDTGDEREYRSGDVDRLATSFTGVQFVDPLLNHVEYGPAKLIEGDGERFFHYVSESVSDPSAVLYSDVDEDRIEKFDVGTIADDDGAVRNAAFVVEADRSLTVELGVGEIGSTTVTRPDWYDEAADS